MSREEARRQALTRFGGVEYVKEQARDEFRPALLDDFSRDLRYGVRLLFRAKVFSIVAILTLGLGIGAATAVFSVVNGVLLRPCPTPIPIASSDCTRSIITGAATTTCRSPTSKTGSQALEASARWRKCRPRRSRSG